MENSSGVGLTGILEKLGQLIAEPPSPERDVKIHGQIEAIVYYHNIVMGDANIWWTQYKGLLDLFLQTATSGKGLLTLAVEGQHLMFSIECLGPYVNTPIDEVRE